MKEHQISTSNRATPAASHSYSLGPPSPLLYERIGGRPAIRRLVTAFYRRVVLAPDIRAMHTDINGARVRLERFLVAWFGGPKAPVNKRKPAGLRARHFSFRVGSAEKSTWMQCMRAALDETVPDVELKTELELAFERAACGIVNRDGGNGD